MESSGHKLRWVHLGWIEIDHQGWLLSPPTRLNSKAEFSMGLRPRLSADAAFAAYWNPGLAPGDYSMNPVPRQCCDLGESGEAAVGPGQPRKPLLQVFPIERRSRASTSPAGRTRRSPGEVAFSSQGGELLWAVAEARGRVDPAATKPRRRRFRCTLPESSANPKTAKHAPTQLR